MTGALVTTIIPVYNGAAFIKEALASIADQQSCNLLEIIVVDDGSTDDTPVIVQAFAETSRTAVRYLRQENRGPAAARNRGIAEARGPVLAFLDADDRWTADKLAIQLALLEDTPPVDIVLGYARIFRKMPNPHGSGHIEEMTDPRSLLVFQAGLFQRSVFERVGLLNEDLRLHEDSEWFFRAREAGARIKIHSDAVLLYQRHEKNLTKATFGSPAGLVSLLKQSLARRRANERQPDD